MTDIKRLARRLRQRIEWQNVPEDITMEDIADFVVDAIRYMYVATGRSAQFSEDKFTMDNDLYETFADTLPLDEEEYVLVTAEISFYQKVQTSVSDLVSYTTNALSVAHGDKPFANLQSKLENLRSVQRTIWYKMTRYTIL